MINISIKTGHFPDNLKLAKLQPIHKGGDKDDPSNYRPISVLPVVSKIIEKHVTKHLFGFLNKYDLLHKCQSGFRKHHSCNTALLNLVDKWLKNIDQGEIVGAIFFDLKKAFDVVNHAILLQKLESYKFDQTALNWVSSYLTNRKQCIVQNNSMSSMQPIKAGVPQGSVLGPVIFLLFINDLPLFINEAYLEMYADDTTAYFADKDKKKVETHLQNGTTKYMHWCCSNDMHIHIRKTSSMILGSRYNVSANDMLQIIADGKLLKNVEHQKLLGIIIDKNLTWDQQIDSVCLNITRRITLLKLLSKYVNKAGLNQYFNSYILPIFDYGCLIWSRGSSTNNLRLLKLQKRAARIILNADILTPSESMFKELQWLSFSKRVLYHKSVMMFKALHGMAPEYLSEMFVKTSQIHSRSLRSTDNDMLRVPYARTNYFENSFTVSGVKLWNTLPLALRLTSNLNTFKQNVKSHLQDN